MTPKERALRLLQTIGCEDEKDHVFVCVKCLESAILAAVREAYEDVASSVDQLWWDQPIREIVDRIRARMEEVCK